jgi:hypothetical protein
MMRVVVRITRKHVKAAVQKSEPKLAVILAVNDKLHIAYKADIDEKQQLVVTKRKDDMIKDRYELPFDVVLMLRGEKVSIAEREFVLEVPDEDRRKWRE